MSVNPELRKLDIDIPAQPQSLVQLSLLMADDNINLQAASSLVESDMALAAAVMKAVNSSLYGLKGRVQSVQQAITFLGLREIAAITFEMGLRAAFPPAEALEPLWQRASQRGMLMSRLAQRLSLDAWAAHSAGLFEECGKAVLFRHASDHYCAMLRAAVNDTELVTLEHAGFGVSHDALGAALCESWGLGAPAVASVRHHVAAQAQLRLPELGGVSGLGGLSPTNVAGAVGARRGICALSVLAHVLMDQPDQLDAAAPTLAAQADLDLQAVLRVARQTLDHLQAATTHGRSAALASTSSAW
jgi:HD-like signal output (HDOD) protein